MLDKTYRLLNQEANLARSCLINGFNHLSASSLIDTDVGNFYAGWFQITTGFERLMKLVITADYMIKNDYTPISDDRLREMKHDLCLLHSACSEIHLHECGEKIELPIYGQEMLNFLSNFAVKSRFYNLGELSKPRSEQDPLLEWYKLLWEICNSEIPHKKRSSAIAKIRQQLEKCGLAGSWMQSTCLSDEPELYVDFHIKNEIVRLAKPYSAWLLIQLLSPMYRILFNLEYKQKPDANSDRLWQRKLPCLFEYFPFLLAHKHSILRRKGRIPAY